MKKYLRLLPIAAGLLLLIFSTPFWLPSLQASAAPNQDPSGNPFDDSSAFVVLDAGWTAGGLTQRVMAVPQVLAWSSNQDDPIWAAETGFIYGGFRDPSTGRIYITEQRNTNHDSLLNVSFAGDVLYATSSDWFMHLTTLDGGSGAVIDRVLLDIPARQASGSALQPIGISGETLYLMNFAYRDNLFAFDLSSQQLSEQSWSLCEVGYIVEAEFLSNPARIAALCVGHDDGSASAITLTTLESGEQKSLEIPVLGSEAYQTGNGMFAAGDHLYAIDSEAGVLVQIKMETMQVSQTSHYREGLAQQSSFLDELFVWLGEQLVRPASAKRWMALTAVSPDGTWVVVDGGFSGDQGANNEVLLVDLQTLEAVQSFELQYSPTLLEFGSDGNLLVLFDKRSISSDTPGVLIDIQSAKQQSVALPSHGWIRGIMPAN